MKNDTLNPSEKALYLINKNIFYLHECSAVVWTSKKDIFTMKKVAISHVEEIMNELHDDDFGNIKFWNLVKKGNRKCRKHKFILSSMKQINRTELILGSVIVMLTYAIIIVATMYFGLSRSGEKTKAEHQSLIEASSQEDAEEQVRIDHAEYSQYESGLIK